MYHFFSQRKIHRQHRISRKCNELQVGLRRYQGYSDINISEKNQCLWKYQSQSKSKQKSKFFNFSASLLLCLLKVFGEWSLLIKWDSSVMMRKSESIWSFKWVDKNLKKFTRKRWKLVALKTQLISGVSSRTWSAFLRGTCNAARWNCPWNYEELMVSMWQPGEDVNIAMRRV